MGGFANNAPIVTDGLVFYVDAGNGNSYPGTGTTWGDLIGSNDGALEPAAGPTYDSANGGSIVFDGTDDLVETTYTPEGQSAITICSWFKTTSTVRSVLTGCYSGTDSTNTNSFAINLNRGSVVSEQDSIFYLGRIGAGTSNTQSSYITNTSLSDGNWHFVAITHDLPTAAVTMSLDGVSYSVTNSSSSTSGPWGAFEFDPRIGCNNSQGTNATFFDGSVASLFVYDKVLSSAEITQNYSALKNRFV